MAATPPSDFGDLLKRYRLAAGLTHEQLAERSGLSARGISDLERRVRLRPHKDTVVLLAEALALGPAERALLDTVARGHTASPAELLAAPVGFTTAEEFGPRSFAPLIGRDDEWKRMLGVWRTAVAGQPRLLVLSGEAGIGKTRLAEELLDWANRRRIVTAVARCYSAEGDLGYAPVITWLRADSLRPGLERLDVEWLSELARLAPDLVPDRIDVRRLGPMTEGWQRQRLFEALARAVVVASGPTLLLIDDLQWCGRDSLEWLHFLLRFNNQACLLVVATARIEEVHANQPLVELLNALHRESRLVEISLGSLSPEETTTLANDVTGGALDDGQAAHLYTETEGNPLFVVETARAHLNAVTGSAEPEVGQISVDAPSRSDVDLPPGIRALVARRLSQVTPAASALLGAASVIGRSFTLAVLARVASVDDDQLVGALDELWDRRIVREHGSAAYDFTHDKLRAVAYVGLSPARRRLLHRRVAEALEAEYASELDDVCEQLAVHYERAGLPTRAASFYLRSAAWARRIYSNETAIASYRSALALIGALPPSETALIHDQLGEVLHLVGRYDEAWEEWQRAVDLTPELDRITRGHLFRKLGNARRDQQRHEDALRAYDLAEAVVGPLDSEATEASWQSWVEIQRERLLTLYWLGHTTELMRLLDDVRPIFEKHGSAAQRAGIYLSSLLALLRRDRYWISPAAMENARAYRGAVEEADDVDAVPASRFHLGFSLLWADDLAEAEEELGAALALAERNGDPSLEIRYVTYLAVNARKREQVEIVQARAERGLRIATIGQMPWYVGAARGNLAWVAWRSGDLAAARTHGLGAIDAWKRAAVLYPFEWIGRWPLIGVALEQGEIVEASANARVLLDEGQQRPPPTLEPLLEAAVRAVDAGDFGTCRAHLEAAAKAARPLGYL